jgi:hypothetical protein
VAAAVEVLAAADFQEEVLVAVVEVAGKNFLCSHRL